MGLFKKREIEKALEKAKKLEQKEDLYTIEELKKEDSWFIAQAKKLPKLLARFPVKKIKLKKKTKKSKSKKKKSKK